jgi:hypothetical protein
MVRSSLSMFTAYSSTLDQLEPRVGHRATSCAHALLPEGADVKVRALGLGDEP